MSDRPQSGRRNETQLSISSSLSAASAPRDGQGNPESVGNPLESATDTAAENQTNLGDDEDNNNRRSNDNNDNNNELSQDSSRPVQLYQNNRLKNYITMFLASFIHYDAAQKSSKAISGVPPTPEERRYAIAVSVVSLVLTGAPVVAHLDRITPLKKIWIAAFRPKSRYELALAGFLATWWTIATGIQTSVNGIAGDAKGQYSLYFSSWACLYTSYGLLDAWLIALDDAQGMGAFITSWPNRAPAWLCIMFLSLMTSVWYLDLWRNRDRLDREEEAFVRDYFDNVSKGLWLWLIILAVSTFLAATAFVVVEIVRETKETRNQKPKNETLVEGICFFSLVLAWIPTVVMATAPGGPASLIGNAYFFTWLLVIFIFEGVVWYIHDVRQALHRVLKEKDREYRKRQQEIIHETEHIQSGLNESSETRRGILTRQRSSTEFFDCVDST